MGERVPQHIQNLVIRDYCQKNGFNFLLSATEYAMENCHLIFNQLIDDLTLVEGIALYSLFQLPTNAKKRELVYASILEKRKSLHFAVEGLKLESDLEMSRIEDIWKIKVALPNCLNY